MELKDIKCSKTHSRVDELNHIYVSTLPSVSTIKEMIYPFNYGAIPEYILIKAQNKGNCVHKQVEIYIVKGCLIGCMCEDPVDNHNYIARELMEILDKQDQWFDFVSEQSFIDELFNGSVDLQIIDGDNIKIVDFKTTSTTHIEEWKLQLNLYSWLVESKLDKPVNFEFEIWHANNKGNKITSTIYKLEKFSESEKETCLKAIENWHKINCQGE